MVALAGAAAAQKAAEIVRGRGARGVALARLMAERQASEVVRAALAEERAAETFRVGWRVYRSRAAFDQAERDREAWRVSYISRHVSFGCLTKCGAYYTGFDAPEGTLTHSQVGDRIRAAVATLEAAAATLEAGRRFRRWSRDPRCQAAASAMQALLRSCPCVARRRECRFRSARALQALARGASVRRQAKLLASSATAVVRRAAIACVRRAAAACALDRAVDAFFRRTGGRMYQCPGRAWPSKDHEQRNRPTERVPRDGPLLSVASGFQAHVLRLRVGSAQDSPCESPRVRRVARGPVSGKG